MQENMQVFTYLTLGVNVALVLITLYYAWLTRQMLKANQRGADAMESQSDALMRPYIVVDAFAHPGERLFRLRIRNLGATAAENLKLTMDKPFYALGRVGDEDDIARANAFAHTIPAFVPKAELIFNLGASHQVFQAENANRMPTNFCVDAAYEYRGRTVNQHNIIDLGMYLNTAVGEDPMVRALKDMGSEIRKGLDEIQDELSRSHPAR